MAVIRFADWVAALIAPPAPWECPTEAKLSVSIRWLKNALSVGVLIDDVLGSPQDLRPVAGDAAVGHHNDKTPRSEMLQERFVLFVSRIAAVAEGDDGIADCHQTTSRLGRTVGTRELNRQPLHAHPWLHTER